MSSLDPLCPRSAFLGLGERLACSALLLSVAFMGLAGLESPLPGFLLCALGLPVRLWFCWESCCPLGRLACLLPRSLPAPGEPGAPPGCPLGKPSETAVSGEEGDCSEAERETEDGEAGDDWPSVAESLGKLEVGMVTLSFTPGKQQKGKKIIQWKNTPR